MGRAGPEGRRNCEGLGTVSSEVPDAVRCAGEG